MFRLFRKKTKPSENPIRNKVGGILAKSIRHAQIRFATALNKQESRLTVTQKKYALVIFMVSMTSLSGYWVYEGIYSKTTGKPGFLKFQDITAPKNPTLPDSLDIKWLQEYKHGKAKKDSLPDSLKR